MGVGSRPVLVRLPEFITGDWSGVPDDSGKLVGSCVVIISIGERYDKGSPGN